MARAGTRVNGELLDRSKYLTDDELRAFLLVVADRKRRTAYRDRVMFTLLVTVGMRPTELLRLIPADLNLGVEPWIRIRRLKSRRAQGRIDDVPIGMKLCRLLKGWLLERGPGAGPVFNTQRRTAGKKVHGPLTLRALERLFKRYAKAAGVASDTTLYSLRHTAARRMLEATGDMRTVQVMLGHSSIRTTEIYAHVTMVRRRQAAESILGDL
jgi:integrase